MIRIDIPEDCHPQVVKLYKLPQYEQRSPEWFSAREGRLTSSDLDVVLGNSKYQKPIDVLFKKCGMAVPFTGNRFTRHGQKYEDEAIEHYCRLFDKKTLSFGLLPHPSIGFLGGSPDDITTDGIVIEVKCPLSRTIVTGEIPGHYISQIKMNMEIADLDESAFIEYKPEWLTGGDMELNVVNLVRDPEWLPSVLPILEKFWKDVLHYREHGIETHPKYEKMKAKITPKNAVNIGISCNKPSKIVEESEDDLSESDDDEIMID